MYWVNGQQQQNVDASDRACTVWGWLFQQHLLLIRVIPFYYLHINRLKQGCNALFFTAS